MAFPTIPLPQFLPENIPTPIEGGDLPTNAAPLPTASGSVPGPPPKQINPILLALLFGGAGFAAGRHPAGTGSLLQGFMRGQDILHQYGQQDIQNKQRTRQLDLQERGIVANENLHRDQLASLDRDRRDRANDRGERQKLAQIKAVETTLDTYLKNKNASEAIRKNPRAFQVQLPNGQKVSFAQAWMIAGRPFDESGNPVLPEPEDKSKYISLPAGAKLIKDGKVVLTNPSRGASPATGLTTSKEFDINTMTTKTYIIDKVKRTKTLVSEESVLPEDGGGDASASAAAPEAPATPHKYNPGDDVLYNGKPHKVLGYNADGTLKLQPIQ